jgi:hypothetical protein
MATATLHNSRPFIPLTTKSRPSTRLRISCFAPPYCSNKVGFVMCVCIYIYILNVNLSWLMGGRGGYSLGGSTLA